MLRVFIFFCAFLIRAAIASPQDGDVVIERHGSHAVMKTDTVRPLHAIASRLGGSAEDPFYRFIGDLTDMSQKLSRLKPGTMTPNRQKIEIDYEVSADGSPKDLRELLQKAIAAENAQTPFAYRLDIDANGFTFVPTRTRDTNGDSIAIAPLLDRRVTISPGHRQKRESAELMAADLSTQTPANGLATF